ncbi:MAG TPA: hypothetical protein VND98_11250 [Solirubrobacterales bacterium]|nr:hypothetical protein [Solirubrobacterales bacterium]
MLDVFTIFLRPESLPAGVQQRPRETVVEAVAGGLWTIVQVEIVAGPGGVAVASGTGDRRLHAGAVRGCVLECVNCRRFGVSKQHSAWRACCSLR